MNKPENDDSVTKLLREWTVNDPLPPRFQEQVWKRISASEATSRPAFRDGLLRLLEVVVPKPKFALSYVAVLLLVGLAAGVLTAQAKTSRMDAALSARYVQSINPYQSGPSLP